MLRMVRRTPISKVAGHSGGPGGETLETRSAGGAIWGESELPKMPVTRKLQARGVTDVDRVGVRDTYLRARRARGTHPASPAEFSGPVTVWSI